MEESDIEKLIDFISMLMRALLEGFVFKLLLLLLIATGAGDMDGHNI